MARSVTAGPPATTMIPGSRGGLLGWVDGSRERRFWPGLRAKIGFGFKEKFSARCLFSVA